MTTGIQSQQVVSNLEYDWLTVMQSKAEALNAYDKYIQDAREANSEECVELFNRLKQTEAEQIQEIRQHLTKTMSAS
ncbi:MULTISPECIES: hypothetical protein [Cyanophyceae]|uniref:hypothetical protein n=1 Tax=Cyanophyceae TaxID=3028117 RepID=UPI00168553B4|nr:MULTISPECIES: hypothetical protein [Cyanophyceae]MBD1915708.1 hypothetical protein [Phormidium sp. FACHB-77]MBD2029043.1 hypothetical protein [Phormidium sp. FACHB-322]MBD2052200.1 hypothetical protein [Leptolyngbya sp. FACHB-60]